MINRIQKYDEFKNIRNDDVILALNKLRNRQEITISNNTNMNGIYTLRAEFIPTYCWFPGCILLIAFGLFAEIIIIILSYIFGYILFIFTAVFNCLPESMFIWCPPSTNCV